MTTMEIAYRTAEIVRENRAFRNACRNGMRYAEVNPIWRNYCTLIENLHVDLKAEFSEEYAESVIVGIKL